MLEKKERKKGKGSIWVEGGKTDTKVAGANSEHQRSGGLESNL